MSYHDCETYFPKSPKVGDIHRCICGVYYKCSRRWPWKTWDKISAGDALAAAIRAERGE